MSRWWPRAGAARAAAVGLAVASLGAFAPMHDHRGYRIADANANLEAPAGAPCTRRSSRP
jgi:hypothetical protein